MLNAKELHIHMLGFYSIGTHLESTRGRTDRGQGQLQHGGVTNDVRLSDPRRLSAAVRRYRSIAASPPGRRYRREDKPR